MNYMDLYLQHFLKVVIKRNINDYKISLDRKLKSIENYIEYLKEKKTQMNKLIDSLTATLENKYIDITNTYNIKHAQEINNYEIEGLKTDLIYLKPIVQELKRIFIVAQKKRSQHKGNVT